MFKLILLAFGAWLVFRILKGYNRSIESREPPLPQAEEGEDMVRCAHCGVHLPRSESILSQGEFFCSEAHRKLRK